MKTLYRWTTVVAAVGLVSAAGCRVDPGETDYASQQISDFEEPESDAGGVEEFLPGPDPFSPGDNRLTFGPFYEGAESDEIPVDDTQNFFFVFQADGRSTLQIEPSDDRIEGFQSDAFVHAGTGFWGMSLAWFTGNPDEGGEPRPEDLSRWETLHISFKSSDASFEQVEIGIATSGGEGRVMATDYGYDNDGEWHSVEVPLDDFGVDTSSLHTPLVLVGGAGTPGDALLVDNFYYSAE